MSHVIKNCNESTVIIIMDTAQQNEAVSPLSATLHRQIKIHNEKTHRKVKLNVQIQSRDLNKVNNFLKDHNIV